MKKLTLLTTVICLLFTFGITDSANAQTDKAIDTVFIKAQVDCHNCKNSIEHDMAFAKGVKSIDANVESKVVTISYKSAKTDPETLLKEMKEIGFEGELVKTEPCSSKDKKCCSGKKEGCDSGEKK